jgi:hypothetical protein
MRLRPYQTKLESASNGKERTMTAPMHPDTMIGLVRQRQRELAEEAAERRRIRAIRRRRRR